MPTASQHARQYQTLLFAGPRRIELGDRICEPLKPDEVRIQTLYSGISRGTEMTVYRGTAPYYSKAYDPQLRLFRSAEHPSWTYPLEFGYENVGRIVEVGSGVEKFQIGDVVFTPTQHTQMLVMSTTQTGPFFGNLVPIIKLPTGLAPELGVFLALAGVAHNAILDGQPLLGESVAVFGGGVIGLLTIQMCRMAGAEQVFLIEPVAIRSELAQQFGATHVFDPSSDGDISLVDPRVNAGPRSRSGHRGDRGILRAARGHPQRRIQRPRGRQQLPGRDGRQARTRRRVPPQSHPPDQFAVLFGESGCFRSMEPGPPDTGGAVAVAKAPTRPHDYAPV